MEICDLVNGCEEGYILVSRVLASEFDFSISLLVKEPFFFFRPRDAVKAIKKRIVGNKNFKEVMLALTVSFVSCLSCLIGQCQKNSASGFSYFQRKKVYVYIMIKFLVKYIFCLLIYSSMHI